MTVLSFIKLVKSTRQAQTEYYRIKTKRSLEKALSKEYELDKVLKNFEFEQDNKTLDTQLSLFILE